MRRDQKMKKPTASQQLVPGGKVEIKFIVWTRICEQVLMFVHFS